jgi:hypothetical protein
LYFGTEDLEQRIEKAITECAADVDDNDTPDVITMNKHLSAMALFINLYILSDKLLDPMMANLVIDKLISFTGKARYILNSTLMVHIYASTPEGNPLRMLARD